MVPRLVQELFRTAPEDLLTNDLPEIMKILTKIGDDLMLLTDLLEQIPYIAAQAAECSTRVSALKNVVSEYLIPLVVRNLGSSDTAIDRTAHSTLIRLIEEGFVTKPQAEIQVCPSVLALSKAESSADINKGAITLMGKLAPLLGRDVTERIFLKRFLELCADDMFYIRKACATHFGEFCAVVGKEAFEKTLLPCYMALCEDHIWGVRKACAEVIMYVSCACPPIARKLMLAPVFIKLLQDECRWVRMSAFQTLGPFISTFANPTITNVGYNKGGDLILVNGDGSELQMNCCRSFMNEFKADYHCDMDLKAFLGFGSGNEVENVPVKVPVQDTGLVKENLVADTVTTVGNESKDMDEVLNHFLKDMSEERKETETVVATVHNNLEGVVINMLTDGLSNVILDGNETVVEKSAEAIETAVESDFMVEANDVMIVEKSHVESNSSTSSNTVSVEDETNKVNFTRSESDTSEDDGLHLFNSYNYWYISPDMPLDPSIIADDRTFQEKPISDGIGSHLEQIYSTINLSDSLDDSNTTSANTTISVEDSSNVNNNADSGKPIHIEQDQDIVPQLLVDNFISMTDPNQAMNIDNEMTYHCAFSLPAVALTLGRANWHLLKNTVECLASDMQYKVRRTVASSLHELALILGPEIATTYLAPLFDGFIKDLDEVRIGVLKHLAHFLKLINPGKRNGYLPKLVMFLQSDNESNWRFRHELAQQLLLAVTLFKPSDTAKHMGVIAKYLLYDKVAAVRQVALSLVTEIVKYSAAEQGLTTNLLVMLAERFAHSKKWKRRQTFALLCSELLKEQAVPPEQFASEVLPHLNDLSWDPVANVRLVVARCLAKQVITNDYFADPSNEQYDGLEKVLRRLQADKDRDVRQSAEVDNCAAPRY